MDRFQWNSRVVFKEGCPALRFSALQHGSLVPQDFDMRKKRVPVVPARFLAVIYAPLFDESAVKCSVQR